MTQKKDIDGVLTQKVIAVAGVSRSSAKFCNMVYRDLKTRGYTVYPLNPNADTVEGDTCYRSLNVLPQKPDALIVITPPAQTEAVIQEAVIAGVKNVWIQQGAETPQALELCRKHDLQYVSGECVLMYLPNGAWFHRFHGWINRLAGKAPN